MRKKNFAFFARACHGVRVDAFDDIRKITVKARKALIDAADQCATRSGTELSQFVRDAMREKAERALGVDIPRAHALMPSRKGKGGSPSHRRAVAPLARHPAYPQPAPDPGSVAMNDGAITASSIDALARLRGILREDRAGTPGTDGKAPGASGPLPSRKPKPPRPPSAARG